MTRKEVLTILLVTFCGFFIVAPITSFQLLQQFIQVIGEWYEWMATYLQDRINRPTL